MEFEKDVEKALGNMIKRQGGLCLKWVCPGWLGVPDRIILLPRGRILFVETKRGGEKPRKMQIWWARKLTSLGFNHYFIFSKADVAALEHNLTR